MILYLNSLYACASTRENMWQHRPHQGLRWGEEWRWQHHLRQGLRWGRDGGGSVGRGLEFTPKYQERCEVFSCFSCQLGRNFKREEVRNILIK